MLELRTQRTRDTHKDHGFRCMSGDKSSRTDPGRDRTKSTHSDQTTRVRNDLRQPRLQVFQFVFRGNQNQISEHHCFLNDVNTRRRQAVIISTAAPERRSRSGNRHDSCANHLRATIQDVAVRQSPASESRCPDSAVDHLIRIESESTDLWL